MNLLACKVSITQYWVAGCGLELTEPGLIGEESPHRVVFVVPQAPGDEVNFAIVYGWHPCCVVGQLAVDGCPQEIARAGWLSSSSSASFISRSSCGEQ